MCVVLQPGCSPMATMGLSHTSTTLRPLHGSGGCHRHDSTVLKSEDDTKPTYPSQHILSEGKMNAE